MNSPKLLRSLTQKPQNINPSNQTLKRRQAALRQMGLIPQLDLSQQEAEQDQYIPTYNTQHNHSEADKIKNNWVKINLNPADLPLPPSPPLTPTILTPTHTDHFHLHPPPRVDSPLPPRSRSPSLPRSTSRSRSKSPLRFLTPNDQPPQQQPKPTDAPQRRKTVFARFKRANSFLPTQRPKDSAPTRSKSLFTSVRKTVFGLGATPPASTASAAAATATATTVERTPLLLPSLPPSSPSLPSWPTDPNPVTTLPSPCTDGDDDDKSPDPDLKKPTSAELDLPPSPTSLVSGPKSDASHEQQQQRERGRSVSSTGHASSSLVSTTSRSASGKGIGLSLILNNNKRKSSLFNSPPASPVSPSTSTGRIRGRAGRVAADGLLSVWGGLLGGGSPGPGPLSSVVVVEAEDERQPLSPTIHNDASILLHMSHIEDEETRRMTEVAFM